MDTKYKGGYYNPCLIYYLLTDRRKTERKNKIAKIRKLTTL
jgi:hypothetical protein